MLGGTVPVVALVLAASGDDEAAIVCAAIATEGPFTGFLSLVHESIAAEYDTTLAEARDRLGPDTSTAATARGAAMDYHEAIAFLLAELDAAAEA